MKRLSVLLAALLCACGPSPAEVSNPTVRRPVEIEAVTAQSIQVPNHLSVVGTLAADEHIIVSSEVGGTVSELSVDFGDNVERGDILFRLDAEELKLLAGAAGASLAQAEAVLRQARSAHGRARELHQAKIVSADELERALSQLRVAEASRDAAEKQLAIARDHILDTEVRSPVRGVVAARFVTVGQYLSAHAKAIELVVVDPLRLRVEVPERFAGAVRQGMVVSVEFEGFPGETFDGTVARLAAALDPDTRTLSVETAIPNADSRLKPGQFAQATINLGTEEAIVVPRAALDTFAGIHRAFVVNAEGAIETRNVTPGRDLGEAIVVLAGIRPGERVATSQLDRLADGVAVEVVESTP